MNDRQPPPDEMPWWQARRQQLQQRMPGATTRNSLWLLASQGLGAASALIYIPMLARYLGTANYGRYSFAYAFVGLFEMLSILGLHPIVEREAARDRESAARFLGSALWIKAFLAVGTFVLIVIANFLFNGADVVLLVLFATAENLIRRYTALNRNVSRAFGRMDYEFVIIAVDRLVALAGVIAAIRADLGLLAIFAAFLLGSVMGSTVSVLLVWRRLVAPDLSQRAETSRFLWKESLPIGVAVEAGQIYQRQGTTLLNYVRGAEAVGIFSGGFRMYQISRIVADSVVGAFYPAFARAHVTSRERLMHQFGTTTRNLLLIATAIGLVTWTLASPLTYLLLGPAYEQSAMVLRWLSPAIVLTFLNVLFTAYLQATDRQRLAALITGATVIVNLILNLLLIARFGFLGVTWAWLAAEGLSCLLGAFFSLRRVSPTYLLRYVLIPVAAGVLSVSLVVALGAWPPLITVLLAEALLLTSTIAFATIMRRLYPLAT